MKTVFIFTFVLDWKTRECKIRIRIRISSFLFSELRQDSIEEEEIIFMLFDFFAVHGKIKSTGQELCVALGNKPPDMYYHYHYPFP